MYTHIDTHTCSVWVPKRGWGLYKCTHSHNNIQRYINTALGMAIWINSLYKIDALCDLRRPAQALSLSTLLAYRWAHIFTRPNLVQFTQLPHPLPPLPPTVSSSSSAQHEYCTG